MEDHALVALLLITGLAFLAPLLAARFRRIRLPIVVGEIFAGMLIGRSGLDLVQSSATLTFLSEFGFAFLMFLSGLELDVSLLVSDRQSSHRHSRWAQPLPMALILFAATALLGLASGAWLSRLDAMQNPLLLGLILSTTSLGIVVPVLKERSLLNLPFGQYLLAAASIADFATLLLLTVLIAVRSQGFTLDLLLIPALLAVFFIAARLGQIFSRMRVLQHLMDELSHATAQIRIRAAFALLVAWVVLSEALGIELILGAFLAGTIASLIADREASASREKLDAIGYGFFIPVFFIMVGVEFNLPKLLSSSQAMYLVPLLAGLAFAVKTIPAILFRFLFSWRETISAGFLLSSRLSLVIASAAIAFRLELISEAMNAAIILLAVLTSTLSPVLFNATFPWKPGEQRKGIILVGTDATVQFLARRFSGQGEWLTAVCGEGGPIRALREKGVRVVPSGEDIEQALINAGADQARVLVDLTGSAEETVRVTGLARERFHIPLVVSRTAEVALIPRLQKIGVKVVQPALALAMALEGAIRYPGTFDILMHQTQGVEIREVILTNRSYDGCSLSDLGLPSHMMIVNLIRLGTMIVPDGDTVLELGDRIAMIGSQAAVDTAAGRFTA